jgi:hypothetical protein
MNDLRTFIVWYDFGLPDDSSQSTPVHSLSARDAARQYVEQDNEGATPVAGTDIVVVVVLDPVEESRARFEVECVLEPCWVARPARE